MKALVVVDGGNGMYQEQAAQRMKISRPTFARAVALGLLGVAARSARPRRDAAQS